MEGLQKLSFEMLSNVGAAKSCFIEAMEMVRMDHFDNADAKIKEGQKDYTEGHRSHMQMIQSAGSKEKSINLLIALAEDQMMATETIKILCNEMVEVYKLIHPKN